MGFLDSEEGSRLDERRRRKEQQAMLDDYDKYSGKVEDVKNGEC